MIYSKIQRRQLELNNATQPMALREISSSEWPINATAMPMPLRVFRSREYLVQEYAADKPALVRLSVCRTELQTNGNRWSDGITWDDLQRLKRECGYGDMDAIEVYPRDEDIMNVANMRHLWIMIDPIVCAWRSSDETR